MKVGECAMPLELSTAGSFPGGSVGKNLQEPQETWLRCLGGEGPLEEAGSGSPLQYACLGSPMDRGARQACKEWTQWRMHTPTVRGKYWGRKLVGARS